MTRHADQVYEEYLVILARSGDRTAFSALFQRWNPRAMRHANRLLNDADGAADAAQDAWLSAARTLGRLDDPAAFPAWFLSIVSRRCIDAIRRGKRGRKLAAAAAADPTFHAAAATGSSAGSDLAAAIRALAPSQRAVIGLYYQDGLGVAEIGRVLGLPAGTVKSRLHSARDALKTLANKE